MRQFLDFEKPVAELENKLDELRRISDPDNVNIDKEISQLQEKTQKILQGIYANLTPWQKVQVARHGQRPHARDYIHHLFEDFTPLAGDRLYGDDKAIIGGLGYLDGQACVIVATERGNDLETRLAHNFGMARPEGYRKAQRLMKMADHFGLPVLTFIDTAGAWPGIDAEERGQAEAIAQSISVSLDLKVPLIATIIGEGGSGGAVALASGDKVLMLEYAIYSVISPEACASILWRDPKQAQIAASTLSLTSQELLKLGLIDDIIHEPVGGAQRNHKIVMESVREALHKALREVLSLPSQKLKAQRQEKFLNMGRALN